MADSLDPLSPTPLKSDEQHCDESSVVATNTGDVLGRDLELVQGQQDLPNQNLYSLYKQLRATSTSTDLPDVQVQARLWQSCRQLLLKDAFEKRGATSVQLRSLGETVILEIQGMEVKDKEVKEKQGVPQQSFFLCFDIAGEERVFSVRSVLELLQSYYGGVTPAEVNGLLMALGKGVLNGDTLTRGQWIEAQRVLTATRETLQHLREDAQVKLSSEEMSGARIQDFWDRCEYTVMVTAPKCLKDQLLVYLASDGLSRLQVLVSLPGPVLRRKSGQRPIACLTLPLQPFLRVVPEGIDEAQRLDTALDIAVVYLWRNRRAKDLSKDGLRYKVVVPENAEVSRRRRSLHQACEKLEVGSIRFHREETLTPVYPADLQSVIAQIDQLFSQGAAFLQVKEDGNQLYASVPVESGEANELKAMFSFPKPQQVILQDPPGPPAPQDPKVLNKILVLSWIAGGEDLKARHCYENALRWHWQICKQNNKTFNPLITEKDVALAKAYFTAYANLAEVTLPNRQPFEQELGDVIVAAMLQAQPVALPQYVEPVTSPFFAEIITSQEDEAFMVFGVEDLLAYPAKEVEKLCYRPRRPLGLVRISSSHVARKGGASVHQILHENLTAKAKNLKVRAQRDPEKTTFYISYCSTGNAES